MKLTKYVHSCLLAEEQGTTVLVDPGSYTIEEGALHIDTLEKLDFVLITHEHQDHLYVPFLKQIIEKFPAVLVISNGAVVDLLSKEGIQASIQGTEKIEMIDAPHEKLLSVPPHNVLFHLFGRLTHPGDSFQFSESKEILALPVQAPWGSMVAALEKAVELRPKLVVPIHDWHWNEKARKALYAMAESYLQRHDIEFHGLEAGESLDIIHGS